MLHVLSEIRESNHLLKLLLSSGYNFSVVLVLHCYRMRNVTLELGSYNLMKRVSKFDMDKKYLKYTHLRFKKIHIFRLDLAQTLTSVFPKSACKAHFVANDFIKRRESEY
jgi:hypothetical protein